MALSPVLTSRLYREGDIVACRFLDGATPKLYTFRIQTVEYPNNYYAFSLGSANALASAGTGWNSIQTSNNSYILEPEYEDVMYQTWYGISPSYAWVYRQMPSGKDRGSLIGTRQAGVDPVGIVRGVESPFNNPSYITETHTLKGARPAYYGYHPYAQPASINIRMNFYIATYLLQYVTVSEAELHTARIITFGGRTPMQSPSWLIDMSKKLVKGGVNA